MSLIAKIKRFRLSAYVSYYRRLPIKRNRIVMWADSFKHYGCSPKYLTEYLLRERPGKYDIVWVFETGVDIPEDFPAEIRVVRYFSLEYLKEIHTARYIVCNMRIGQSYMWRKREGQKYIQTWHSSIRLKKIEMDAGNSLPQKYIEEAKADSGRIDLLISGCEFSRKIFHESFWYHGPILNSGTPRCDIFFSGRQERVRRKIYEFLKIYKSKRIMLYAPTFRNDKSANLHGIDFRQIKAALERKSGVKWECLYRFHPNIVMTGQMIEDGIDVSRYSDMQELLAAAHVLITDYSSCMFDMAIARKPCILFAPDIRTYLKSERGLYFNPEELPFPMATDNERLVDAILDFDEEAYFEGIDRFLKTVGSYEDGNACRNIVEHIEKNL